MKTIGVIAIFALATSLSLGAAEFVIRASGLVRMTPSGWGWAGSPLRTYQPPSAANEANSFGMRGQEISYEKTDYVVLLVGDSQVEAAAGAKAEMPEAHLQRTLAAKLRRSVKVFSLASSGWGQDQELLAMQKYFNQHRADQVLVWATPTNDFWENTFVDRSVTREASHIKPTFSFERGKLQGPFFPTDFYVHGSAIVQMLLPALLGESVNDYVLDGWRRRIPMAGPPPVGAHCEETIEIDQEKYFTGIFSVDRTKKYTVLTHEDLPHGRSHFAPVALAETELGRYQRSITRALFARMRELATEHHATFQVFYPVREDLDDGVRPIACVKADDGSLFEYQADFQRLLSDVVPPSDLLFVPIAGKDEIVVGKDDRHLNAAGNAEVAEHLTKLLPARSE